MKIAVWSALLFCATLAQAGNLEIHDRLKEVDRQLRSGKQSEAITALEQIVTDHPQALQAHLLYQKTMGEVGRERDLINAYKARAKAHPDDAQTQYLYARLLDGRAAVTSLRKLTRKHPEYARGWVAYSSALRRIGQLDKALDAAVKGTELDAAFADGFYARARVLEQLGRNEEADRDYRAVFKLDPAHVDSRYRLAHFLTRASPPRANEAFALIDAAADAAPNDPRNRIHNQIHRGIALATLGRDREAVEAYESALKRAASDPLVLVLLADAYSELSEWALARRSIDRALALDPRLASAYAARGYLEFRQDNYSAAIKAYRRASREEPKEGRHLFYIGLAYERSGKIREATSYYRRAGAADPGNASYRLALGATLENHGKLRNAFKAYRSAVKSIPDNADLWIRLGHVAVELRKTKDASKAWLAALELAPKDPELLLALAILHDESLNEPEAALEYYKRYLRAGGKDARVAEWIAELERRTEK